MSEGSAVEQVERTNLNPYLNIEDRLSRHEVPIKREFLKEVFADEVAHRDERPPQEETPVKKKGRYTKSAKRERKQKRKETRFQGTGFCNQIAKGQECNRPECKFSHDIEGYMKQKPADIGPCILFDQLGECPYGLFCRFGGSHIKDGKLIRDEEKIAKAAEAGSTIENLLDRDIQQGLRRKKILFTRSKAALPKHSADLGFLKSVSDEQTDDSILLPERSERKTVNFEDKLILAPLTTVGNLPFRRICKGYGADITVGEMALATQILNGSPSEWALVKRHACEDIFGVQLAGSHPDSMAAAAELLNSKMNIDFIDINCGCPIDVVCNKGAGSSLMTRKNRLESICKSMIDVMEIPLTIKLRMGVQDKKPVAHNLIPSLKEWGVSAVTLHGRSKEQRYTKAADFEYITQCANLSPVPFICNGDTYSWQDAVKYREANPSKSIMIARGAIIKPWIFKEIKEQKDYDISGSERLDMIQDFVNFGLENWGSDQQGIDNIRNFLLNWMSFLCRYVPVGIVEHFPIQINHRPPLFVGRDDKETLLSSIYVKDWIKISEMFLGPVSDDFSFVPKHRANAYPSS